MKTRPVVGLGRRCLSLSAVSAEKQTMPNSIDHATGKLSYKSVVLIFIHIDRSLKGYNRFFNLKCLIPVSFTTKHLEPPDNGYSSFKW